MDVTFFEDPLEGPQSRDDVRLKQIGLFVHEDGRRVAVGLEMTPFRERPSIEITITNAEGREAGSLTVIEALRPNMTVTIHLRDGGEQGPYGVTAVLYYASPDSGRQNVHTATVEFDATTPGEQVFPIKG